MIRFQCVCGKRLKVADTSAGHKVKCGACGAEMVAPAAVQAAGVEGLDALAQAVQSAGPRPTNGAPARPGQAGKVAGKPNGVLPGQSKRPAPLPDNKLPFYIGLGVAGGIMLIVLIVAAISFSGGNNNKPVVKPAPVVDPTPPKPRKHEHIPGEMFPNVDPTN